MDQNTIDPCPFCNEVPVKIEYQRGNERFGRMRCDCGACGPWAKLADQGPNIRQPIIDVWNNRSGPGRPDICGDWFRAWNGGGPISEATKAAYGGPADDTEIQTLAGLLVVTMPELPDGVILIPDLSALSNLLTKPAGPVSPYQGPAVEWGCIPWDPPDVDDERLTFDDGWPREYCVLCHDLLNDRGRCPACEALIRAEKLPLFEYATTEGPRKLWSGSDDPPDGEGWIRNRYKGRDGWERFSNHEESYWYRIKPGQVAEANQDRAD